MAATGDHYYIPDGSKWPIIAVAGIFSTVLGFALWMNSVALGPWVTLVGVGVISFLFYGWFSDVIEENLTGKYNKQVSDSFKQGMMWFITSEVFFFVALFGALYYIRNISLPWLGGQGHLGTSNILWDGFQATWPLLSLPSAEKYVISKEAMGAGGIPLYNTVILLSSGATLTWSHWGLKNKNKNQMVMGLLATVALGLTFFSLQAYEYSHAYAEMDLQLNSGIYGSTFYMLTGFHGLHVTIGTIMLIVILFRAIKNHFTPENHFGFEAVAWYWHFVDVVWLGLYIFVYWL